MTQKEAIERLAKWGDYAGAGISKLYQSKSEGVTSLTKPDYSGWAAEKYLDLLAGNVRACTDYGLRQGRTVEDAVATALETTHATIAALEVEE